MQRVSSLFVCAALLALPLRAAAVTTTLEVTAPADAVPQATIQIYDLEDPQTVVEEKEIDATGAVVVDLPPDKSYGARIEGGPVLAERFGAGEVVRLAIPAAFTTALTSWSISIGTGVGGGSQRVEGEAEAGAIVDEKNKKSVGGGGWAGDVQVMAPSCGCLPGSPRLFVQGGSDGFFDRTDTIASGFVDGVVDVDLETRIESSWYVGMGVQFSVDVLGHEVRVKPSVSYGQERIRLRGTLDEIGVAVSRKTHDHTVHLVRPEVAVETPLFTHGPIEVSGYVAAGTAIRVGGRSRRFTVDGVGGSADYRFKKDSPGASGHAGVRISWSPLLH